VYRKTGRDQLLELLGLDKPKKIKKKNDPSFVEKAEKGEAWRVTMALKRMTDVNSKGKNGNTALIVASLNGHKHVVEILLLNGADVNIRNRTGITALGGAVKMGNVEIAQLLKEAGTKE
jgi:hypothetical protein